MTGIPSGLTQRLQKTLLRCSQFDSNSSLRSLFVDSRIHPWRDRISDAGSRAERVAGVLNELLDQRDSQGCPALVLFLLVLGSSVPSGDGLHGELLKLTRELEQVLQNEEPASTSLASENRSSGTTFNISISGGQVGKIGNETQTSGGVNFAIPLMENSPSSSKEALTLDLMVVFKQLQLLSSVELDRLCLIHLPEVYDQFKPGLDRDEKINLILGYCRKNPESVEQVKKGLM